MVWSSENVDLQKPVWNPRFASSFTKDPLDQIWGIVELKYFFFRLTIHGYQDHPSASASLLGRDLAALPARPSTCTRQSMVPGNQALVQRAQASSPSAPAGARP